MNKKFALLFLSLALVSCGLDGAPGSGEPSDPTAASPQIGNGQAGDQPTNRVAFMRKRNSSIDVTDPKNFPGQKAPQVPDELEQYQGIPSNAKLSWFGGPVIQNVKVVEILWGNSVYSASDWQGFYSAIVQSGGTQMDWLSEYNTSSQHIGAGSFVTAYTDTAPPSGTTITDAQIQAEISKLLSAGSIPAPDSNTYYAVMFPPGVSITQGGHASCSYFCAYHSTYSRSGSNVIYGVIPDHSRGGCADGGCGTLTAFQNACISASHEMVEAITDPAIGVNSVGWYDNTNGEIGDICAYDTNTGQVKGYTVQTEWSNASKACVGLKASQTLPNDFSMSASPTSLSVGTGRMGTVTIMTSVSMGSPSAIALTTSSLPAGVTASFNPQSVTPGQNSTMTISVDPSAATGPIQFTVTGTAGQAVHTTNLSLTVTTSPANDFSLSLDPSHVTINQGGTANVTLNSTVTFGSAEALMLAAAGLPSGVQISFNPSSMQSDGSTTIQLTASATATIGNKNVPVSATNANNTHSTTLTVSVVAAGTPQPDAAPVAHQPDAMQQPQPEIDADDGSGGGGGATPGNDSGGCSIGSASGGSGAGFIFALFAAGALVISIRRRK
jgi:hypothetical protein